MFINIHKNRLGPHIADRFGGGDKGVGGGDHFVAGLNADGTQGQFDGGGAIVDAGMLAFNG